MVNRPFHEASLTLAERQLFRRAQRRGFLATMGCCKPIIGQWRAYCDFKKRAFLRVTCARKTATLFLDLSSTDLILSPKAQTAITALCTLTGGHWHKCTANFVLGNGIPKESAEPLARILRQLLRNLPQVTHRYDEKIA